MSVTSIQDFSIRAMRDTDLQGATALSTEVGWPYRSADWRFALALGRGILAECDERVVASALWWPFGDRFATCGMIIVSPSMQRRGLGRALMTSLLHDAGERTLLLNSTEEGLLLYRTFGFQDIGTVHQHQAWTSADMAIPCADAGHVRAAVPDDLHAIENYQRAIALDARDPMFHYRYAISLAKLTQLDRAIPEFEEALRLRPHWAIAHEMLGRAYLMRGDPSTAQTHFDEARRVEETMQQND